MEPHTSHKHVHHKDACPNQWNTYHHSSCSNSAPMTLMCGHVNEWHGIKTKKQKDKP